MSIYLSYISEFLISKMGTPLCGVTYSIWLNHGKSFANSIGKRFARPLAPPPPPPRARGGPPPPPPPPPPPRATGLPLDPAAAPLPLLPPSVAAAGRGRRAKPGRRRRQRPSFPRVVEERVRALLVHGGGAPRATPVRRGRETLMRWRCAVARVAELHDAVVAAGGRLAQIWASRASDGLGWPQMGLGGPGRNVSCSFL
jgi:hypothetical protein